MIDLDAVTETRGGSRYESTVALLIGLVALSATAMAVIQVQHSADETRAHLMASRLASDITTRIAASTDLARARLLPMQAAAMGAMGGVGRQIVNVSAGDPAQDALGGAEYESYSRLVLVADRMAQVPTADGPLDPYAQSVLASIDEELVALSEEQNRQADAATLAGERGNLVVLGLSLVALAAVLAGLAAGLGEGWSGRLIVVLGYATLAVAVTIGAASLL